jgi:hypothetical protein
MKRKTKKIEPPEYYTNKDKWDELQRCISGVQGMGFLVYAEPAKRAKNTKLGKFPLVGVVVYPDGEIKTGKEKYESQEEATIALYNIYLFLHKKYGN